jgi:pimeloyl-ACP methyl ester carboxylesterase
VNRPSERRVFAMLSAVALAASATMFLAAGDATAQTVLEQAPRRYRPTFEAAPCPPAVPRSPRVDCGILTVPENRNRPQRAQVRLPVAIVRSEAAERVPDPIVHLTGGPGGAAFPIVSLVLATDLGGPRDVIVLSQRGAAASIPSLDCPRLADATWARYATAAPNMVEARVYNRALRACRARLRARHIDLNSYNTISNAADVADLRIALGLKEWNLWGFSYGTLLAQEVMRHHPGGLRSVVLDSLVPTDKGFGGTEAVHRAMDAIEHFLGTCAATPACAAAYRTLRTDLHDVVAALDAQPHRAVVTDPASGVPRTIAITGRDVMYGLANLDVVPALIPKFPQLVSQLKAGQYAFIENLATTLIPGLFSQSEGMWLSVMCSDYAHVNVTKGLRHLLAEHPAYEEAGAGGAARCRAWPVRASPRSFNRPVSSTIPTLVFAGEWDGTTPPKPARHAASHFQRPYFVEFPGRGHVVMRFEDLCSQMIFRAFVAEPTQHPDTRCVRQAPPLQ